MATTIAKPSRISSGYSGENVGLDGFKDPESATKRFAECVDVLLLR
jgi:hypothetical protein